MSETQPLANQAKHDSVGAVLLAGGLARRMQGQDKGLMLLNGKPMASYALSVLLNRVSQCVINANRNVDSYAKLSVDGVQVIPDTRSGHLGPLAGLSAAIESLQTSYVLMCPCDSPFLQAGLIDALVEQCKATDADVAVAHDGERLQPVFSIVNTRVKDSLDAFLDSGERKIDRWFLDQKMVEVDARHFSNSFRNINTEEELQAAEQEMLK